MIQFYALRTAGGKTTFKAKTIDELDKKIDEGYWLQHGMSEKGTVFTKDDYLKGCRRVKVTIEPID